MRADTKEELTHFVIKAKAKFWKVWIQGQMVNDKTNALEKFGAALYKPSGINAEWFDSPEKPHLGSN